MQFDWWTFAFQVINVLVLMWLLGRFLFRPVADIIARRAEDTRQKIAAAEAQQQRAAKAEAAARAETDRIAAERMAMIEEARGEAEALRKSILDKAREQAVALTREIKADAVRARDAERADREQRAIALSVEISRRLLDHLPSDGRIAGYADRLKSALQDLTPGQKQAFATDKDHLRLRAPRALDAAELQQATEALQSVFPDAAVPKVEIDESLIAGLELAGRHSVLHNSLRHDLGRITEALIEDAAV